MKFTHFAISIVCAALIFSCAKDNVADLKKTNPPPPQTVSCDTTNVSFSAKIVPIMELQCGSKNNSCHTQSSQRGGVYLDSYEGVVKSKNSSLLNSIKWVGNASRMPKSGAKLDDCSIAVIETWINQGFKNN